MCVLLTGALLNIVLDPIFICALELGVAGAAIATAISQFVSTLVYLRYIFKKECLHVQPPGLLFFKGGHVRDLKNRHPHACVPTPDRPGHHAHQHAGEASTATPPLPGWGP